jgi:hypothetical protein
MKVAILISGHLRTFNKTKKNLLEFISHNKDIYFDLFLHINDKQGSFNLIDVTNGLDNIESIIVGDIKKTQFQNLYNLFVKNEEQLKKYDLLIRTRFDNEIKPIFKIKDIDYYRNKIIIPIHRKFGYNRNLSLFSGPHTSKYNDSDLKFIINDRFCICEYELMKKYCSYGSVDEIIWKFTRSYNNCSTTEGGLSFHLFLQNANVIEDEEINTNIIR